MRRRERYGREILAGNSVLVVEDSEVLQQIYRDLLERCGYVVYGATTGAEALRIATATPMDSALVDMSFPWGEEPPEDSRSRYPGARLIRELSGVHGVPCVAISGQAAGGMAREACDAGAFEFMTKSGLTGPELAQSPFAARLLVVIRNAIVAGARPRDTVPVERPMPYPPSSDSSQGWLEVFEKYGGETAAAAEALGCSRRKVQRAFRDLEESGRIPRRRTRRTPWDSSFPPRPS